LVCNMCSGFERFRSLTSATPTSGKRYLHTVLVLVLLLLLLLLLRHRPCTAVTCQRGQTSAICTR
jgi:hypothetical protein